MDMITTIYKFKVREFEKKYREILLELFKEMSNVWGDYRIRYNKKRDIEYTSFVRYCYNITDKQYDI